MNSIFDRQAREYDDWFDRYPSAYLSELGAVRGAMCSGESLEVGVGTGRFAGPLGARYGLDPSTAMLEIALKRGVEVIRGVAESLPFAKDSLDNVLFITSLCFIEDPDKSLAEARRVVGDHGRIIVGIIDRESIVGREYVERAKDGAFYRNTRFFSVKEVLHLLDGMGDWKVDTYQTIFTDPREMTTPDPVLKGHGKGLFAVLSANIV